MPTPPTVKITDAGDKLPSFALNVTVYLTAATNLAYKSTFPLTGTAEPAA